MTLYPNANPLDDTVTSGISFAYAASSLVANASYLWVAHLVEYTW